MNTILCLHGVRVSGLLAALPFFLGLCASQARAVAATDGAPPRPSAVATFSSLSLYWSPAEGAGDNPCEVSYRRQGESAWHEALPLWFDARNKEYRGSIVSLQAGTPYEVKLHLSRTDADEVVEARTWSETVPIARVISLPAGTRSVPLIISEGGTPDGYVLYEGAAGRQTLIDLEDKAANCVEINAPYVIVRGLKLAGASRNGILLEKDAHDVRIEDCDISGWGRIASDGFGENVDSGVFSRAPEIHRIVIQGNRIHHPRANSNDWTQPRPESKSKRSNHPLGPQGISLRNSQGNNVIRFNEIYSDEEHRFNDGMGYAENYSFKGFPGQDSDIYGNIIRNVADDALEIEGGGQNVRVWGNYMDTTFNGLATVVCSVGPLYIFRNVMGRARSYSGTPDAPGNTGNFAKIGSKKDFGDGRVYYFHNTLLQPRPEGMIRPLGASRALATVGGPMTQTVSRNNIWQTVVGLEQAASSDPHRKSYYGVTEGRLGHDNDLDYDLLNNPPNVSAGQYAHVIDGTPVFADPAPENSLRFEQAEKSPAYDAGVRIPNFNDDFAGKAPDLGAQERGAPPLPLGIPGWNALSARSRTPDTRP